MNIRTNRWIPNHRLGDVGNNEEKVRQRVSKTINQRKKVWKLEAIKEYISDEQEQEIMEIPICRIGGRDRIIWPHTIN